MKTFTLRQSGLVSAAALLVCMLSVNGPCWGQSPLKPIKVGAVASGATVLPSAVISQQKIDEKYGLKIEWVKLDQASAQIAFAMKRFDVNFAQVPFSLILEKMKGDNVTMFRSGTFTNNYFIARNKPEYKTISDLKGTKIGIYGWNMGSTVALSRILKDKYNLSLKDNFQVIVGNPMVLLSLFMKGEIEGMCHVDPDVIRLLKAGEAKQIFYLGDEWEKLTGTNFLVTGLAVWQDYAQKNPDLIKTLSKVYDESIGYIKKNPSVYVTSGHIKEAGLEPTPDVVKMFQERYARYYTVQADWNQKLIESNKGLLQHAVEMKVLDKVTDDWYTFGYQR